MLTDEVLQELAKPFPPDVIQFKPGATTKDNTKALALAYADTRAYLDRLDEAVGAGWGDDYEVSPDGQRVVCRLTIGGVTRCDVGECDTVDKNTTTSAAAQAFKRAAAKFGLGRYIYNLPSQWVAYDKQSRRFTDQALATLRNTVGKMTASMGGAVQASGLDNGVFRSPSEAIAWGMAQDVFKAEQHAHNAYKKLKGEKDPKSAKEMAAWWRADVARRYAEMVAAGAGKARAAAEYDIKAPFDDAAMLAGATAGRWDQGERQWMNAHIAGVMTL
jgi:hypothetical protein